jgi:hypothetical protein
MAPKILQYFDQDLCDDTINFETIENIDFDEDELLEPSTAQTQTTPPQIPEFVQILVFNKRIPLDANNSYIVIVKRIVRFEEVLSGVRFDGPSFHENDYKKNTRLLDVIQNNAYTLGMSTSISDPRPFIPSISPTTSNRFKSQYGSATNAQKQPQDSLSSASKKTKSKKNKISKSKIAHSKGPN